ncbi:hypothetical protein [Sulfobacillus harzensis]|uniref:hypothetical protein n=1 Tax=Sulfobacillus harzensis TaxID=2729629 RepID=UPI001A9B4260|nr:hypothetical protein [Sulfobacillus harzensis]
MIVQRLLFLAALLAVGFAVNLAGRFKRTHAPVYGWWTLSFLFYAAAFLMEALTVNGNWQLVWEYQIYMVASAGLVGTMSVGTVYLALPRSRIPFFYGLYVALATISLALFAVLHPPVLQGSWLSLNAGKNAIVGPSQISYLLLSAVGGPVVVLGALWSWWKVRRYYTLLIGVGALVPSLAGTFASQGLGESWFPVFNIVGLILIFLGYVYSRPRTRVVELRKSPLGRSDGRERRGKVI